MIKVLWFLFFSCACTCGYPYTQQEELEVAQHLVRMIMSSPEWVDNVTVLHSTREVVLSYQTYDDLFSASFPSNHIGFSWTPQERKAAFEDFIYAIPDLSTNGMYKAIRSHGVVALGYCLDHGATNVLASVQRILSSPHSVARNSALAVFRALSIPTEKSNECAAQILMNKTEETKSFRKYYLAAYADVLRRHRMDCSPQCFTNGVSIVKAGVYGWCGTIELDELLLDAYPEYAMSSNRLAIAIGALSADEPNEMHWDWRRSIQGYFAPITNQLMNAAQPLPEVEALRGL